MIIGKYLIKDTEGNSRLWIFHQGATFDHAMMVTCDENLEADSITPVKIKNIEKLIAETRKKFQVIDLLREKS